METSVSRSFLDTEKSEVFAGDPGHHLAVHMLRGSGHPLRI